MEYFDRMSVYCKTIMFSYHILTDLKYDSEIFAFLWYEKIS